MKFKNILILICSVCLCSGCDDYLDLVPEDDILTIPKIFETRSGAEQWMIDANMMFSSLTIDRGGNPAFVGADEYTANAFAVRITCLLLFILQMDYKRHYLRLVIYGLIMGYIIISDCVIHS